MNDPRAVTRGEWQLALAHAPQGKPEGRDVDAKLARLEKAVDALVAEIRALRESVGRDTSRTVRGEAADGRPPRPIEAPKATVRWKSPNQQPAATWSIHSLAAASGTVVVSVRDADGTIGCKNLKGQLLWQTSLGKRIIPQPMVHGDLAYFLVQQAPLVAIVDLKNGRWTMMDLPSVQLSGNDLDQDLPAGVGQTPQNRQEFDDNANSLIEATKGVNAAPNQQSSLINAINGQEKSYEERIKALEDRTEQLLKRLESQQAAPLNSSGAGSENDVLPAPGGADTKPDSNPADNSGAAAAQDKLTNPYFDTPSISESRRR